MLETYSSKPVAELHPAEQSAKISRRKFFEFGGTGIAIAAAVTACKKDNGTAVKGAIDIGSGDVGILNYAYALEQLEAAFYIRVLQTPYSGPAAELALLADIRDHEIAHREFFKNALGSNAIQSLTPDFSAINFSDRTSVLSAAKAFEDTGVAAYNGAGKLFSETAAGRTFLTLAGKIVSVEARHAAYIREIITANSFANGAEIIDSNGLDISKSPADIAVIANAFLSTKISVSNLPTT